MLYLPGGGWGEGNWGEGSWGPGDKGLPGELTNIFIIRFLFKKSTDFVLYQKALIRTFQTSFLTTQ